MSDKQQFVVAGSQLKLAVTALNSVINKNKNIVAYEQVVFKLTPDKTGLILIGSNQETSLSIPVETKSISLETEFCVNFDKFKVAVQAMNKDDDIKFTLKSESASLVMQIGRSKLTLQTLNTADYPFRQITLNENDIVFDVDINDFGQKIKQIQPFIAVQDVRHYLCGMAWQADGDNKINIYSTDGHRGTRQVFHVQQVQQEQGSTDHANVDNNVDSGLNFQIIVPRNAIAEIVGFNKSYKEGVVRCTINSNGSLLKLTYPNGMVFVSSLLSGAFPAMSRVLYSRNAPSHYDDPVKIKVDIATFMKELDIVRGLIDANYSFTLKFKEVAEGEDGYLLLKFNTYVAGNGNSEWESEIPVELIGDWQNIQNKLFNNNIVSLDVLYLRDMLSILTTEKAEWIIPTSWGTPRAACFIFEDDEESHFESALMPKHN